MDHGLPLYLQARGPVGGQWGGGGGMDHGLPLYLQARRSGDCCRGWQRLHSSPLPILPPPPILRSAPSAACDRQASPRRACASCTRAS